MPITTSVDAERNLTIHTMSGRLTFKEITQTLDTFYRKEHYPQFVLWDGRDATIVDLSQDEIRQLAVYSKRFKDLGYAIPNGKRALLAPTSVDYGLARMIGSLKDILASDVPFEVRTFRDHDEAVAWLTDGKTSGHTG